MLDLQRHRQEDEGEVSPVLSRYPNGECALSTASLLWLASCEHPMAQMVQSISVQPTPQIKLRDLHGVKVRVHQQLRSQEEIEVIDVRIPYSRIYGCHPSRLFFCGPIGSLDAQFSSDTADPFTGKSPEVMQHRRSLMPPIDTDREHKLMHVLKKYSTQSCWLIF